jgi:hypothetical protein
MSEQLPFGLSAQEFRVAELAARGLPLDEGREPGRTIERDRKGLPLSRRLSEVWGAVAGRARAALDGNGRIPRRLPDVYSTVNSPRTFRDFFRGIGMPNLARCSYQDCWALTFITEEARASGILHCIRCGRPIPARPRDADPATHGSTPEAKVHPLPEQPAVSRSHRAKKRTNQAMA